VFQEIEATLNCGIDTLAYPKVDGLKYIFVEMESNPAIMEGCARFLKSLG
jgi:hypothetical protein